jgi:hypothetical protein
MLKAERRTVRFDGIWIALWASFILCTTSGFAQSSAASAIVIEGGTLIDGNGGVPARDSVVVIQDNKITAVSRKGQVTYPPNAKIIRADGKFVLPGLWDSQVSNSWHFGEAQLNHGVTSTIDVGTDGETSVPYRDAAMHGKIIAPRGFTGISRLSAASTGVWSSWTGLESPLTPTRVPKSAEETRAMVRARVAAGADYVTFYDGALPIDFYRAGFDEARKTGTPVFTRAYGPVFLPKDAALMGAANLPHSAGIGIAVAKDSSKWNGGGRDDRNELDRYAEMDDAKAKDLIQVLVEHKVALVPTFMINFPGYPKDWAQFEAEGRKLFSEPNLLAYYPATSVSSALANYGRIDRGELRERRMKGYQNAMRFHKMFVEAGGHLVVSGNTNDTKAPGLDLHHEMQIMAEAGISPMQIIVGSTKWPAEMIKKHRILGTVEAGKLGDVIIVNADPLQDIKNLDNIDTVIFDGNVLDCGYHSWYRSPFNNVGSYSPTVEGLAWTAALKKTIRDSAQNEDGGGRAGAARTGTLPNPVNSPQPAIETIEPYMVTQGTQLEVTITGFNFVRRSKAYFDGKPVPLRAVSPNELRITLDGELVKTAGRFDIVVKNPEPLDPSLGNHLWGNGTSNQAHLIVNFKYE